MQIGGVLQCDSELSALTLHGIVCIIAMCVCGRTYVSMCVNERRNGWQRSVVPVVTVSFIMIMLSCISSSGGVHGCCCSLIASSG